MSWPFMSTASERRRRFCRPPPSRQRGVVLVAIMAVLFVTLMIASSLINHFVVKESEAIERNLVGVQAYWAQVGQLDYTLSRAMHDGQGLNPGSVADLLGLVNGVFPETLVFAYDTPDGGSYDLQPDGSATNLAEDGQMEIRIGIVDPGGAIPALSGIENSLPILIADVCIGDLDVSVRTATGGCVSGFGSSGDYGLPTVLAMRMQTP